MKINEITIDRNKRLADQLSNAELSNEIMAFYEMVKEKSCDFSLMAYEASIEWVRKHYLPKVGLN